jgi:RNA polymerase sigma factor (sigma-70 family)
VTPRFLQAVLRSLAAEAPPADDGELVRRFAADRSADAFAELVRRHGRLVWAVCRHLTRSDAEADDAFQATFLVLLRGAGKVRDPNRLSAWLHGVAYRVCSKARQSAKRRAAREKAAAAPERNGSAVPDSGWDRALAAVHEEAGRLPDALRVPFVLCCLEGKGQTEAAAQLGWKLGTLSGRLTRAKDAILARLDARGLTLAAVAGLGLAAPPAEVAARAAALSGLGAVIPASVLHLSQGVIGMSAKSLKMLAAAVFVAGGLGVGLGTGVVSTADAQDPKPARTDADLKRAAEELEKSRAEAEAALRWFERALNEGRLGDGREAASAKTKTWEYDFVLVSEMTMSKFVAFLEEREARGWEYNGLTRYLHEGKMADIWVFRRPPAKSVKLNFEVKPSGPTVPYQFNEVKPSGPAVPYQPNAPVLPKVPPPPADKSVEVKKLEAEVQLLRAKLDEMTAKLGAAETEAGRAEFRFDAKSPLSAAEASDLLGKLAPKKFPGEKVVFQVTGGTLLTVTGSKGACQWAAAAIKALVDK